MVDIPQAISTAIEHQSQGRLDQAEPIYRRILEADPSNADALHLLGVIAFQTGKSEQALELISKAIESNPNQPSYYGNLALVAKRLGRAAEAIEAYERAISLKPDYAEAHYGLGNLLTEEDRLEEAVACFEEAVAIRPDDARSHHNLGSILSMLGKNDRAASCYEKAIAIKPDYPEAHYNLALLSKCTDRSPVDTMKGLLAKDKTVEGRILLNFGLSKALIDLGEDLRAFQYLRDANRLKRKTFQYDVAEAESAFALIRGTFDRDLFESRQGDGCQDETPLFIVGMPRSGSTLIEQILASHPDVHGAGELPVVGEILKSRVPAGRLDELAQTVSRLSSDELADMGREYLSKLRSLAPHARFVTDKMPANFQHVGVIKLMLPNAKIIHSVRSPEDTCLSIFRTKFTEHQGFAYDLKELGQYYRSYNRMMDHWRAVLPEAILEVHYENLTGNQESETRRMLELCGLEWDDRCLNFHKTVREVRTASSAQVRRPMYRSSVGGWKRFEEQLQPLIETLGDLSR